MLQFKKKIQSDTSITGIQYHSYAPYTQSFANQDEIRIAIQSQNAYLLPHASNLYLEGQVALTTRDAALIAAPPLIISNFASFLFDSIRYELNGNEIDKCKNVGITSTLKAYVSLKGAELKGLGASCYSAQKTAAAEHFSLIIPLKFYMGFFEDYNSIILNSKHELILNRSRNDANCFAGTNNIFAITLTKVVWKMPHIKFDDHLQLKMLKQIEKNEPITTAYRSWDLYEYPALPQAQKHVWAVKSSSHLTRPRYIILAFQTNRNNVITNASSAFDHINLTDARLYLNSDCYPHESLQTNFAQSQAAIAYEMYTKFKETFYHDGSGVPSDPLMSYNAFLTSPIFIFDCSRQNESLKISSVDIKIEIETSVNVPANTTAYCLIIHDNIMQYNPLTGIVTKDL